LTSGVFFIEYRPIKINFEEFDILIRNTNFPSPYSAVLYFDRQLTWKVHIVTKRRQLLHKTRELKWLIGKTSPLSLENKLLLYKTVFKPIWTYGIELWGCATKSNIAIIQPYQSKLLRTMTNAPCYVSNHTLHTDLRIPYVLTVFQERIAKHRTVLTAHPNPTTSTDVQQTTKTSMVL